MSDDERTEIMMWNPDLAIMDNGNLIVENESYFITIDFSEGQKKFIEDIYSVLRENKAAEEKSG